MTDKPRLIDADKLERFLEEEIGGLAAKRIEITIAAGLFDPDPPQQPDIQVGKRNWQEDMNLCMKVDEAWSRELFIADQPDITSYWLQQYAALEREYERFQKATMGWNDDLTKAEAEIEQKDAEIARLTKVIKDANDENEHTLNGVGMEEYESALTELLYKE
ncbi:hypothetical protein D3C74_105030 [compost metagenome]